MRAVGRREDGVGSTTEKQEVGLVRQAHALTADLTTPNRVVYWTDLVLTVIAAWGGLAVAAATPSLAIGLAAGLVSLLALYRGLSFIHEISHLRPKDVPGFRLGWNLLVGVPLMTPSMMYEGVHNLHHAKDRFGTARDPEYLPLERYSPLKLAAFTFISLLAPLGVILRSGILVPLSFVVPPVRRFVRTRLSALVINPDFVREDNDKTRPDWLAQEIGCWLWCWGVAAATVMGLVPLRVVVTWFAVFSLATFVNQLRTLVAHYWHNDGERMTFEEQFLDSVNVPPPALLPFLWAPVGLRYHALHHLLPRLPYHNLDAAHRRLSAQLAVSSPYHKVEEKGLFAALAALFARAGSPASASRLADREGERQSA
ncbi:MAG: fatty acid desaturase [Caulobacter sp.]|nr:fatty acid desaturase [Caulobacter sp.]